MNQPLLILGCVRQVGKDTLAALLKRLNPAFTRYSFADALKEDLEPFIRQHFGFSIWDCTPGEKELVRSLLIAYGMARRQQDPDCWVKRTLGDIDTDLRVLSGINVPCIPVITDGRFLNEITLVKERYPGARFINVERFGAPPPTDEEEKHYREVAKLADYHLVWGNDTEDEQLQRAREIIKWMEV